MDIVVDVMKGINVVKLNGDLDLKSAPEFQQRITPLIQSGSKLVVDMSGVEYMSSAGLRVLLATYRQVTAVGARLILAGVSEDVQEVMSMTGFLQNFTLQQTVPDGVAALQ